MTIIKQDDLIQSVADALQYISYYHPPDFIRSMASAYEKEQSPAARDAIAQILINSRMCAEGHRPICQDTGIVTVFLKVGMNVQWDATMSVEDMVNEGVRRAYLHEDNKLRASILADPAGSAQKHQGQHSRGGQHDAGSGRQGGSDCRGQRRRLGSQVEVCHAEPVGLHRRVGAEDRSHHGRWLVSSGHARHRHRRHRRKKPCCWPKKSLMEPIDIQDLMARGPSNRAEELRLELYKKINALGIGAQGLGGLTTVLDVKVKDYPTHAANLPVAMIPNCAATRHAHFVLDGSGPVALEPPSLDDWPKLTYDPVGARRVDLDTITREEVATWKPGEVLLLSGKLLTGRDAAHKRMTEKLSKGEKLPVDFTNRFIYYVGPVDPVRDEVVGPAGPTTATRMDKFTRQMLNETGLLGMVGKSERGPAAIEAIRDHKAVYLMAVGGAAYLVSKAIKKSRVLAFHDLGMEAIYEFEVQDMPVTVAVESKGNSVHESGPKEWQAKIAELVEIG